MVCHQAAPKAHVNAVQCCKDADFCNKQDPPTLAPPPSTISTGAVLYCISNRFYFGLSSLQGREVEEHFNVFDFYCHKMSFWRESPFLVSECHLSGTHTHTHTHT